MRHVICYDISDDRRRRQVEKALKEYARRVQESVFEGDLDDSRLAELKNRLLAAMDPGLDSIRIYRQCGACCGSIEVMGIGPLPRPEEMVVVV